MKIQSLAIILVIIVLPITLIVTAYTNIQIDTISRQTIMATKLKDATYDAISAFELNTIDNDYSTVSDSMRRDINAAVETFMKSIASNIGISGATSETIKPYIPALVFTLYDGYYIYAPSFNYSKVSKNDKNNVTSGYVIQEGENAINSEQVAQIVTSSKNNAKYEHVLKPYIYYTVRYVTGTDTDVVVNYSLDNYIVVYGKVKGEAVSRAGYLVASDNNSSEYSDERLYKHLPVTTIAFTANSNNQSQVNNQAKLDISLNDIEVTSESLKIDRLNNFNEYRSVIENAIRNAIRRIPTTETDRTKIEENIENQFNSWFNESTGKLYINEELISANVGLADSIRYLTKAGKNSKYITGEYNLGCYIDPNSSDYYIDPASARKYYEGANEFTRWVNEKLSFIKASDAVKSDGSKYDEFEGNSNNIFSISKYNDPEDDASNFCEHKREAIKLSIQDNLSQAMASYNEHSEALGTTYNYKMPILTDKEWDQVLRNVCMISFMEGIQTGTKIFNDYCIVTSTKNKEYVNSDSIYYINQDDSGKLTGDGKYHKLSCSKLLDDRKIVGYRNTEFERKSYDEEIFESGYQNAREFLEQGKNVSTSLDDKINYYYLHENEACYYCIVNSTEEGTSADIEKNANRLHAMHTALAREKYNFYKTNSYIGN